MADTSTARLAVIPARGGSKRIPQKNIKIFFGKPLIAYAIEAAIASKLFDRIIVSTDSFEIGAIARHYGAETPFIRPDKLADDFAPTAPVISHAITECQKIGWNFDYVCCIYPGVPFLEAEDLHASLKLLSNNADKNYCFAVAKNAQSIYRSLKMNNENRLEPLISENSNLRTQDLNFSFYDAGQFYWGSTNTWLMNSNIHTNALGYEIPNWRAIDIDTRDDWIRAEMIYAGLKSKGGYVSTSILKDKI